jgi:hypothetical protein
MWFERFRSSPVQEKTEKMPVQGRHSVEHLALNLPVSFTSDESTRDGQCLSMSDSALLAAFEHPPELWTDGHVVITVLKQSIKIPARVARVNGHDVGFSFVSGNDEDLASVNALIDSVLNPPSDSDFSTKPIEGLNPNGPVALAEADNRGGARMDE